LVLISPFLSLSFLYISIISFPLPFLFLFYLSFALLSFVLLSFTFLLTLVQILTHFIGVVELLIIAGANVNLQDNEGMTPLHYAAMYVTFSSRLFFSKFLIFLTLAPFFSRFFHTFSPFWPTLSPLSHSLTLSTLFITLSLFLSLSLFITLFLSHTLLGSHNPFSGVNMQTLYGC
jgi:Ankyrin repeats (many copies)